MRMNRRAGNGQTVKIDALLDSSQEHRRDAGAVRAAAVGRRCEEDDVLTTRGAGRRRPESRNVNRE